MNAEKTIEKVTAMLYAYDAATRNNLAPEILRDPFTAEKKYFCLAFYGPAAEIIADARADLAKKTGSPVAALKRIAQAASQEYLRGVFYIEGHSFIVSGYHAVKIPGRVDGLPEVNGLPSINDLFTVAKNRDNAAPLELPADDQVKAFIAERGLRRNSKTPPAPLYIDRGIYCNPFYLLDVLEALPGCIAYAARPIDTIYLSAETGEGLLCPVKPPRE